MVKLTDMMLHKTVNKLHKRAE